MPAPPPTTAGGGDFVRKTDGKACRRQRQTVDILAAATPTVDLEGSPNDAGCVGRSRTYALRSLGDSADRDVW
jgi:hypothetical protein